MTSAIAWISYPAVARVDQDMMRCTSHPCPNTETGEDPAVIDIRKANKIEDEIRNGPNDKERWKNLILFSSSTDKESLRIPIVAAVKFEVSLDPKMGSLKFSTPNTSQAFKISEPLAKLSPQTLCPEYQIEVIDGAPGYALIKKSCPKHGYKPGRFYRSTDYFIYDQKTNTAREIWSAHTQLGTSTPFPTAKPEISIKRIKNGYKFDWIGLLPSDNPPSPVTIHNIYKQEISKDGQLLLSCYDATNPSRLLKENEMCESYNLQRIGNP
jgi:hypothetical protein